MAGVKETIEVVDAMVGFANGAAKIAEDGKLTPGDVIYIIEPLGLIPDAIDGWELVAEELADLDGDEANQIITRAQERLDLPWEKAQRVAQQALSAGREMIKLVVEIRS